MIQKKSVIGAAAFFLIMALTVGYFALAADGSRDNPLVTLDYLRSLDPKIEETINAAVKERVDAQIQEFDTIVRAAEQRLNELTGGGSTADMAALINDPAFINSIATAIADQYGLPAGGALEESGKRVTVNAGRSIKLAEGTRIVRRTGAAAVVNVPSGQAGLVDVTSGTVLDNNGVLVTNHEYIVTFQEREIRATENAIFFIWGSFS